MEPSDDPTGAREWRGEVRHALTGRVLYFRHQEGIVGAIRGLCGAEIESDLGAQDQ